MNNLLGEFITLSRETGTISCKS